MSPVFAKLNVKDAREIVVLDAPASFEPELASLDGVTVRGTLTPITVPGWVYLAPNAATIDAGEVSETILCLER